ncbi:hypothetical protein DIURU_001131 [Diutina rugosa]|uniref:RRM domain-containing protein n=1 Tax=Diutina rugosa TaxID=5481 RepID=A0A642UVB2_DIURU|nr:uncharacterized protein DIURU_001131 [Diutina rugosa]KAA8906189.1 hypothetical protein DIURU_001131 [Diutina rugosa]
MYPYYPAEDPLVLVPGWVARPPRAPGARHERRQRPPPAPAPHHHSYNNSYNGSYNYGGYSNPQLPTLSRASVASTTDNIPQPSRTVHIRNISPSVTLSEVLDTIEAGPIEYTKMYTRNTDAGIVQTCVVSFVNSEVCQQFHRRYTKSISNMQRLKLRLDHSDSLQIVVNDPSADTPGQDLIKLKTLNYILDHGATRAVTLAFTLDDIPADLVFSHEQEAQQSRAECAHSFIHHQCTKLGDVERFDVSLDASGASGSATVHFTSIDSAIKTLEFYTKRVANDLQRSQSGIPRKSKFRYDIKFTSVQFAKDRCDHRSTPPGSPEPVAAATITVEAAEAEADADANGVDDTSASGDDSRSPMLTVNGDYPTVVSPSSSAGRLSPPIGNSPTRSASSSVLGMGASSSVTSAPRPYPYHRHSRESSPVPPIALYPHTPQSPYDPQLAILPPAPYAPSADVLNKGNRSIYLGNLHPHTTIEEIANNVRAGGIVESIRYHPEKKVCFITFVDENIAYQFYLTHQLHHQLIIKGVDVTVGWAKVHSGPLLPEVATAVEAGASRNVYIGIRRQATSPAPKLPSEEVLRHDFSCFGDVEQINFFNNRDCGFVNFLNLADAVRVVSIFELPKQECLDHLAKVFKHEAQQVYDRYHRLKISFGKDRCGNPPKFSFKKKVGGAPGSTYQLYQDQLHNQVEQRKRQEQAKRQEAMRAMMVLSEKRQKQAKRKQRNPKATNAETSNNGTAAADATATESVPELPVQRSPKSPLAPSETSTSADDIIEDECTEDDSVVKAGEADINDATALAPSVSVTASPTLSPLKAGEADMVSESDDDDVSIIIDSDENPQVATKPPRQRRQAPCAQGRKKTGNRPQQQRPQHQHHDSRRQLSRNSSSASLSYYQAPPFVPQQSPGYYYPQAGAPRASRSPSYNGYYHQAPSPPYPQMSPQGQHYYTLASPSVYMSSAPVPHHGGNNRHYKQQQQMMAHYLAKQAAASPHPGHSPYGYPVPGEVGGGDYFGDYEYGYKYGGHQGAPPASYPAPYYYGGGNRRETARYRR